MVAGGDSFAALAAMPSAKPSGTRLAAVPTTALAAGGRVPVGTRLAAVPTTALAAMPSANPAEGEGRVPAGRNDWFGR